MHLKIASTKWQPFCPGRDELTLIWHLLTLYTPNSSPVLKQTPCSWPMRWATIWGELHLLWIQSTIPIPPWQYGMSYWWQLHGLQSWCPIFKSRICNSFEDFIYGYPIFKWVADNMTGYQDTRIVVPSTATRWHTPLLGCMQHPVIIGQAVNKRDCITHCVRWKKNHSLIFWPRIFFWRNIFCTRVSHLTLVRAN